MTHLLLAVLIGLAIGTVPLLVILEVRDRYRLWQAQRRGVPALPYANVESLVRRTKDGTVTVTSLDDQ